MSMVITSVIYAALMIIVSKVPVALAMHRLGGYDNRQPREQQAQLEGFGKRALASHHNSIEAFPIFAVGALLVLITGQTGAWVSTLCIAFVIARAAYIAFYLLDWHIARSLVWSVGFLASIGLMLLALLSV